VKGKNDIIQNWELYREKLSARLLTDWSREAQMSPRNLALKAKRLSTRSMVLTSSTLLLAKRKNRRKRKRVRELHQRTQKTPKTLKTPKALRSPSKWQPRRRKAM